MSKIRILDDRLISQIAAGEVVERPASVLKETLENALDASADRVEVELSAGGRERLVVRDNGAGMSGDDALLAFDRHATSKIATFDDLEHVATLGFRGEALSSIAAVAKVELLTAVRPGEGHRVRIEGGRVLAAEPAAAPRGTTIDVAELFWNVPARRKFLKTPPTELRRCLEVVQGYALARPEVGFRVLHEGREVLRTEATGEGDAGRLERIAQLFGAELAAKLVALPATAEVGGWVGNRATVRGRRLFVFVNRRLVRDRAILAVFYRAVRDEWQSDRFPALFLFLDLPPEEVDVNVHPQKSEVRFRDPGLLGRITRVLRGGLLSARGEEPAPLREAGGGPPGSLRWEGLGSGGGSLLADPWTPWVGNDIRGIRDVREGRESAPKLAEIGYGAAPPSTVPLSRGGSGSLRLLGQYKGALILVEAADSLLLVDQHAAHERVLYERFRRHLLERSTHSQKLLVPLCCSSWHRPRPRPSVRWPIDSRVMGSISRCCLGRRSRCGRSRVRCRWPTPSAC